MLFTTHRYCPAGVPGVAVCGDAIVVRVSDAGQLPDPIVVPAERRANIVFTRGTSARCAARVAFPDFGVSATVRVSEEAPR